MRKARAPARAGPAIILNLHVRRAPIASIRSARLRPHPRRRAHTASRGARAAAPRLLVKRDDAIAFAFGGNKVRKMRLVAAQAREAGADTLITTGGVQSNHARVTAAAAAKLGLKCILVANGARSGASDRQRAPRSPARRRRPLRRVARRARPGDGAGGGRGAPIRRHALRHSARRIDAARRRRLRRRHRRARAIRSILPTSSSIPRRRAARRPGSLPAARSPAGRRASSASARTHPPASLEQDIRGILAGLGPLLGFAPQRFERAPIEVDDAFAGRRLRHSHRRLPRKPSSSRRAREALFLDPTYTAKAMAGLVAYVRRGAFSEKDTVLFWHTGGQVGLFA